MDPAAPATRMTSSFTINISTPSFYNPTKKFAPVVPPKPKLNPFKAEGTDSQISSTDSYEHGSGPGIHRAFVGKVGEFPVLAPSGGELEDFVLPPPPPTEDSPTSPTSSFPPPPPSFGDDVGSPTGCFPPPPPPDFPELFPPTVEEHFPSPPPLEDDADEITGGSNIQVIPIEDPICVVPPPPPAPPIFSPKPVAPLPTAPKPVAPLPVAPKPITFVPKSTVAGHIFSPTPSAPPPAPIPPSTQTFTPAPTPPSTQTFTPKPVTPPTFTPKPATPPTLTPKPSAPHTFSPKPSAPHTFSPKPSAPHTFTPKPIDPPIEVPSPQQKFQSPQPGPKQIDPPAPSNLSSTRAPGFNLVQQRERPQVLEKPRADHEGSQPEHVRNLRPQTENGRSFGTQSESVRSPWNQTENGGRGFGSKSELGRSPGPQTENGRNLGSQPENVRNLNTQPNAIQNLKPQPERIQNQRSPAENSQSRAPQPNTHRQLEPDQASGTPGLNMKEVEELEMLTQQLMREMDNQPTAEPHTMDLCNFCGKGLSRTETVVRAGEHLYHVTCFTCSKCDQQLQGQQYYESAGRPMCEECYQDTLECCAVCEKKITERLLRAMGKAYHPSCFTCAVCQRSLQGEPFIVDQNNQPHCVPDYHRRYAPRCSVCGEPIAPEPGRDETVRVVALEKNFHMMCYKCEDCACPLSIEADDSGCFPLDGHVLCKKCHTVRARAALS
ncbi:zyxin isoform 1-T2 [Discoglossus pictus]